VGEAEGVRLEKRRTPGGWEEEEGRKEIDVREEEDSTRKTNKVMHSWVAR
jgi:hypothetical protein